MPGTTALTVTTTSPVSPGMVRVEFASEDLSAFEGSADTDRYVKLVFAGAGDGDEPVVRTYTALDPDVAAGTVAVEFVVHGDEGVAGPWAARARPGDRLEARGPGGGYRPDPTADWHLLVGDESALPAIRAAVQALPADAVGYAVLEVPHREHEVELGAPDGLEVIWLNDSITSHPASDDTDEPGGRPRERALVSAVRALPWRDGRVHAFVHGEARTVMHGIRPYLLRERAVPRADASISGYWRRGRTEESFRVWKSDLAAAESASSAAGSAVRPGARTTA
ncbi:NADPH-dependent ferric siderophore reductase [Terracoccus luteus]|uniref:NADPH-dependent ferric siderophore reductase n=1 Tax=Terracoccus luteus TaxID=53356 RepID=A0A495Y023_9MICO|nr:siderophore-interacting protein [Terracoccus luteus]RKT78745.1 NADPH-dependent ferric siderophore reductase [Terracoccus luteus]